VRLGELFGVTIVGTPKITYGPRVTILHHPVVFFTAVYVFPQILPHFGGCSAPIFDY